MRYTSDVTVSREGGGGGRACPAGLGQPVRARSVVSRYS